MTTRRPCPPAPGPLEDYAQRFDGLFSSLAQRRGLRDYLQGLLLPRDRNKTLTGLAGAEPITGAQHREVQRLQWFLSESAWDHEQVNDRRVQLLCEDPATAPHDGGVLVIDDTGDRKDGTATAHVARQYLGSVGKIDNGIVAVTSLWADERVYWPVHAVPYTPASRLPGWRAGSRVPDQAAAGRRAGPGRPAGRHPVPGGGGRLLLRRQPRLHRRPGRRQGPVRAGPQAPQGHLGAGRRGPHPGRGGRRARLARPQPAWPVAAVSSGASVTATPRPGGRPTPSLAAGARTGRCGWWSPPPTRPACRAQHLVSADQPAPTRQRAAPSRPTWPRSCACTGCATGSSRATSRSKASSAGPTSRSAATGPSAGTGRWCAVRSASAGRPSSPTTPPDQHRPTPRPPRRPRGGPRRPVIAAEPAVSSSWPVALRAVRAWLTPWSVLQRCWRSWSPAPPPRQLQRLLDAVAAGQPLHLYLPP